MLQDARMPSLADKLRKQAEMNSAIAKAIGEKIKPKAKVLRKVGKITKKLKK